MKRLIENIGRFEIAFRSRAAVSIIMNNGNFSWQTIQYLPVHPHEGMDVGDLSCDGDPDIVLNEFWLQCPENYAFRQDEDIDIVSNPNFNKSPLEIWMNTLNEKQHE